MGKFTGLLLASDYDNTLTYTAEALRLCAPMPPVSDVNQAALRHFMAEGGIFSVATGRAKPAFEVVAHGVPMNGPTILFNGAAIYDFAAGRYLYTAFLPDIVRTHIAQTLRALPFAAVELYHDDNSIHALQPNEVTRRHLHVTHSPTVIVDSMAQVPSPISKALFSTEPSDQAALLVYLRAAPWYDAGGADGQGRQQGRHGAAPCRAAGYPAGQGDLRGRPRQRCLHADVGGRGLCPRQRPAGGTGAALRPRAARLSGERYRRADCAAGRKILTDTDEKAPQRGRFPYFSGVY